MRCKEPPLSPRTNPPSWRLATWVRIGCGALVTVIGCAEPAYVAAPARDPLAASTLDATRSAEGTREHPPSAASAAAPLHDTVTADDGHPLAVWSRAPTSEPSFAMLLVHGRTWSSRPDFDLDVPTDPTSTLALLAERGVAAYAVDLRGYGATPRDVSGWLTPHQAVADLSAVLRFVEMRHPGRPPALLGWSMGALCAHLLAQREPARTSAVILYGYPRSLGHVHPAGPTPEAQPRRQRTTAAMAREDFIIDGAASEAVVGRFAEAAVLSDPIRMDWRSLDEFNVLDPGKLRVPTLLIHGEHDPYAPVASQAALFSHLEHVFRAWVVLPQSDHAAHLERTKHAFVDAVVSFVVNAIAVSAVGDAPE